MAYQKKGRLSTEPIVEVPKELHEGLAGEETIIVPKGAEVKTPDPTVRVKYMRITARREGMWRGKIQHFGTRDWRIDGPNPELAPDQIESIIAETVLKASGLAVAEIYKYEPAPANAEAETE